MPPCSILKEEQQPRITQTNKKKRFVQCRTNRSPYYYEHANKYDTICKQALYEHTNKHQHNLLFMYKPIVFLLQT